MLTDRECNAPIVDPGEVDPGEATYTPVGRPVAAGERRHLVGYSDKSIPFAELKARLERETAQ